MFLILQDVSFHDPVELVGMILLEGVNMLKIGFRKPGIKRRIRARTSVKRQVVHRGGIKMPRGYGIFRNPKKAVYNKVYNRTSFDVFKTIGKLFK